MWKKLDDYTLYNEDDPLDILYIKQNVSIRRLRPPKIFDIIDEGYNNLDAAKKALRSYIGTSPAETTIASILR